VTEVRAVQAFEDESQRALLVLALVEVRTQQGLTQADVAHRMGVAQSTVSGFERGGLEGRSNSMSLLQRYARACDARIRFWIEEKPQLVEPPAAGTEGSGEESTAENGIAVDD
jgi:transcriptional regulator with XRE-family HTH domain